MGNNIDDVVRSQPARPHVTAPAAPSPRTFPVVLAGFTAFLDLYATQPILPLLAGSLHATVFAVSLAVTAPTVAVAIAAPVVGRLADAIGRRRVIVGAAAALAVATLLGSAARTLPELLVCRFVQGLCTPGVFAVAIAYIHDEWPAARARSVTAAYVSGTVVGGFCGRAVMGIVAAHAGWPAAFAAVGVMNVAAAAALWAWLPRERHAAGVAADSGIESVLAHLGNGQLRTTYAVGFCLLFSQVAMFTYVTFLLAAPPFGLGAAALGSLFVVYLVGAALTPLAGKWIDRRGHRAGLMLAAACGIGGAALTLAPALWAIAAGLAVFATGIFIGQATSSSHVGAAAGRDRGVAVGLYGSFYYAGGAVGASLPSAFWHAGGWVACVALIVAVQALAAGLGWVFWQAGFGHLDAGLASYD
jgi:predicted MFS family arabinose efflux permease